MTLKNLIVVIFLTFLLRNTLAGSVECSEIEPISYRGLSIRGENDSFAKTDRNYSHGIAITVETHELKNFSEAKCYPWPVRWHAKFFNPKTESTKSFVLKFGQAIYTPKNYFESDLITDDRPYAGLLFSGLSLHERYRLESDVEVLDASEITLGIIGPWSFSKEFQQTAHGVFGDTQFRGWSNQLNNEPAFQVAFDRKFKQYEGHKAVQASFASDIITSVGVRVGNIETSANIGLEGRIGSDTPNDFGSFTIRPGTDSRPPDVEFKKTKTLNKFGFHFFAILDLKYVAYSFSVDGNLFSDSHRVTRQPWISLGAIGLSLPTIINSYGYNLAILQVYQTSDFKEQKAHHAYQTIIISVDL